MPTAWIIVSSTLLKSDTRGRIRLREHFRCMPEIIQFSNNLSYANEPLIPLRRYGAGRLEPTVTARHVPDGYQSGVGARSVNPPEAEAPCGRELSGSAASRLMPTRTVGVISLVGDAQARDVETRVIRRLGPEETERRQLVCGDAYALPGRRTRRHVSEHGFGSTGRPQYPGDD